jgi:long-subunit fatty acid transport protein
MIRSIVCTIVILTGFTALSQSRTSSPYSFFGIGQQTFRGTVENRSMGGMRTHLDSIHINLRNPAAYGKLRLTTFSIGGVHTETWASTETQNETYESTSVEYVSIGIPLGRKMGMGFGLVPFKSVGYEIGERTDDFYTNFTGEGSINRAYFGLGYEFNKNFSFGGELRYNFGREINSSSVALSNVQYGTNEVNESDFSGLSFNFGLHYQTMVNDRLELQASATYTPESKITAVGTRDSSLLLLNGDFTETLFNTRVSDIASEKLNLPSDFTLGATIGLPRKWSLGAEYSLQQASDFSSRNIIPDNTRFTDASSYRVGGYYIPDYNSISSYWNRVVYRGGLRYEETGLNLNGSDINEFGISFGMSLPVGRTSAFSNATFGLEYGQRGTTDNNLIKEDFFSISFGLSLNDKWFQKRKYN